MLENMTTIYSNTLKKAPKVWHAFIRKFLLTRIHCSTCHESGISQKYLTLKGKAKSFGTHSRNGIAIKGAEAWEYEFDFEEFIHVIVEKTVKKASGSLTTTELGEDIFTRINKRISSETCTEIEYLHTIFIFDMKKEYALNLTFIKINFNFAWQDCKKLGVSIEQPGTGESSSGMKLKYCGFYSDFSHFSFSQSINVTVIALKCSFFILNIKFCVLDVHLVFSSNAVQNAGVSPDLQHTTVYQTSQGKIYKSTYYIEVKKIKLIQFAMFPLKDVLYTIFDGPGHLSPVLYLSAKTSLTSSFQCTIIVLLSTAQNNFSFVYHSADLPNNFDLLLSKKNERKIFTLPTEQCKGVTCSVFIKTPKESQIKVSSEVTWISIDDIQTCRCGGLVAAEVLQSKYKETAVCPNTHHYLDRKTFYSTKSNFVLVLFHYKGYSNITARLDISSTLCKAVQINPFALYVYCYPGPIYNQLCSLYLEEVTQHTNLDIQVTTEIERESLLLQWLIISLMPNEEDCVVIQMLEETAELDRYFSANGLTENAIHLDINIDKNSTGLLEDYRQVKIQDCAQLQLHCTMILP